MVRALVFDDLSAIVRENTWVKMTFDIRYGIHEIKVPIHGKLTSYNVVQLVVGAQLYCDGESPPSFVAVLLW